MTLNELIDSLSKLKDQHTDHGEAVVVVEADHGQTPIRVSWVGTITVESSEETMMEESDEGDTVIVLQGY